MKSLKYKENYTVENCARLRYCAASSGNSLSMLRYNLSVPSLRILDPWRWCR